MIDIYKCKLFFLVFWGFFLDMICINNKGCYRWLLFVILNKLDF